MQESSFVPHRERVPTCHLGRSGLSLLRLSDGPWRGAPVPGSPPRHDEASSDSRTWVMPPSNWARAQGHMLGTEPRSFFCLPTDRSVSLPPLEEARGSPACERRVTVPSALAVLAVRGPSVWRRELTATPCLFALSLLCCSASLSALVPAALGYPRSPLSVPFSFSEDAPQISFLNSVLFLCSLLKLPYPRS